MICGSPDTGHTAMLETAIQKVAEGRHSTPTTRYIGCGALTVNTSSLVKGS